MKNLTAIQTTNEILNSLNENVCVKILKEINYNIDKLITIIKTKYPELNGWYYNSECTIMCNQIISQHIIKIGIENVASRIF
jgi:hypothetical protein